MAHIHDRVCPAGVCQMHRTPTVEARAEARA
jgi:hypothetical protein